MDVDILPCSCRLHAYGGNELPVCVMFNTAFQLNQTTVQDEVIVVRGTGELVLHKTSAVALKALVLPEPNALRSLPEELREKFPTVIKQIHTFTSNIVFEQRRFVLDCGLGCPSIYQVKWQEVDAEVPPVAQHQLRQSESNIAVSLSVLLGADHQCPEAHRADEETVRLIAEAAVPIDSGIQEVERESATDPELSEVHSCIRNGNLDQLPAAYKNMRFELTPLPKIVLRRQRTVIPQALRQRTVGEAHERRALGDR